MIPGLCIIVLWLQRWFVVMIGLAGVFATNVSYRKPGPRLRRQVLWNLPNTLLLDTQNV
jgi:hypothetical protein